VSRPQGFTPATRALIADRASDYNGWPVCEVMAVCQGVMAEAVHHRRPRAAGGSRRPDTNQAALWKVDTTQVHAYSDGVIDVVYESDELTTATAYNLAAAILAAVRACNESQGA